MANPEWNPAARFSSTAQRLELTMVHENQKPCLISCGIFRPELERVIADGQWSVDVTYLNPGLHNDPKLLGSTLERTIEKHRDVKKPPVVVVYGDICMGFQNEMKAITEKWGVVKIDALNCIDCLLGGGAKLLEIDPRHEYFFLNPAWIKLEFGGRDLTKGVEEARKEFSMLSGLFLLDTMGDLDDYSNTIELIKNYTGLPVVERKNIGIAEFRKVIQKSIERV
jgi:hypothetical protein